MTRRVRLATVRPPSVRRIAISLLALAGLAVAQAPARDAAASWSERRPPLAAPRGLDDDSVAVSLVSTDLDRNHAADLVVGYRTGETGALAVYRGVARPRPGVPAPRDRALIEPVPDLLRLPAPPEIVLSGRLDGDRTVDLALGRRGAAELFLLAGDGRGGFAAPIVRALPGRLTAAVAGEVNRRDGRDDLVVAVSGADGARILVYEGREGAWAATPESIVAPAEVTALVLGPFDRRFPIDVAALAGGDLLLLRGRDRLLASDPERRATVAPAALERHDLPLPAIALAAADFAPEPPFVEELAWLAEDGSLHLAAFGDVEAAVPPWARELGSVRLAGGESRLVAARIGAAGELGLLVHDPASFRIETLAPSPGSAAASWVGGGWELEGPIAGLATVALRGYAIPEVAILDADGRVDLRERESFGGNEVNVPTDQPDGDVMDGICDTGNATIGYTGLCTLRALIQTVNATGGGIAFDGSFLDANAIRVQTTLPSITVPVTVDGENQVEIDGSLCAGCVHGLRFLAGPSTVTGLIVNSFSNPDLRFENAPGSVVSGNYLGVNDDLEVQGPGDASFLNCSGIRVQDNVVSGTVSALGASAAAQVLDNYIGVGPGGENLGFGALLLDGTGLDVVTGNFVAAGNTPHIWLEDDAQAGLVAENVVGTDPGGTMSLGGFNGIRVDAADVNVFANLASGNAGDYGILVASPSGTVVDGNRVGTDASGGMAVPNRGGIAVTTGNGHVVRDNLVSGNLERGIFARLPVGQSVRHEIRENRVGTNAAGNDGLGNGLTGLDVGGVVVEENVVAGSGGDGIQSVGAGDVIRGNEVRGSFSAGIRVTGTDTAIVDNVVTDTGGDPFAGDGIRVGPAAHRATIQGNVVGGAGTGNARHGILLSGANDALVGGANVGEDNEISHNGGIGIGVGGVGNTLLGNSIHHNGALGIDLELNGPTPNDPGDGDPGSNNRQNFPLLTLIGNQLRIDLNSIATETFEVEVFGVDACDPSGFGEGEQLLFSVSLTTDGAGNATTSVAGAPSAVAATATRQATGDTSEFSACATRPAVVINSDDDDADQAAGNGECDTGQIVVVGGQQRPECTLRAALQEANASPGENRLRFDPLGPAGGTPTLYRYQPGSALPTVTDRVIIDAVANGVDVQINGQSAGAADGLRLAAGADGSRLRGLRIFNFAQDGVEVAGADGVVVVGCALGPDGTDLPLLGNDGAGIRFTSVTGGRVGGGAAGEGNHLSNNGGPGVAIEASTEVVVEGNLVGTTSDGTGDLGNGGHGVAVTSSEAVRIGGGAPGSGNVVSGNDGSGVVLIGSDFNSVVGNRIGTDRTGAAALGNTLRGVVLDAGSEDNVVDGNLISANGQEGVLILGVAGSVARRNLLSANRIGTDDAGTAGLGNGSHGVRISGGARDNLVGPQGNRIAFNAGDGVRVTGDASTGNRLDLNEIFANAGLGVDLAGDGVTLNDPGDADLGPNRRQNFPVVGNYDTSGGATGTLQSTPNTSFLIELFANASCDPSNHGEAEMFVGFAQVTTAADGIGTWNATPGFDPTRPFLTALAIRQPRLDDTSELSTCAAGTNGAPTLLINEVDADTQGPESLEFVELLFRGAGAVPLAGRVVVFYDGATDASYAAFDLDGYSTDSGGRFVLGNEGVDGVDLVFDDGLLLDGPAAVALYLGDAASFPAGTPVTTAGLLDAFVYAAGGAPDPGLQPLLAADEIPFDESAGGDAGLHSAQRCPDGAGEPRRTRSYVVAPPTPDAANGCVTCLLTPVQARAEATHELTATVRTDRVTPVAGATVELETVAGPGGSTRLAAVTDAAGVAGFLLVAPGATGVATLEARGASSGTPFVCRATVDWFEGEIFASGFETGDTSEWSATLP